MCCPVPNRRAMPQWLAAPRTHHYGRACRNGRAISVYSRMKPASGPDSTAGPCCRGSTWPGRAPRSTRQRKALYHVRSHRRHDGPPIRRRFEPILGISVYASAKATDISLRRADSGPTPPTVGTKRTATGVPMSTLADRMLEAKQNKMDRRSRGESIGNCQR